MMTLEMMLASRSPYRDLDHWLHYTDHLPAFDPVRDRPPNLPMGQRWRPDQLKYPLEGNGRDLG
jgi:hypothetical protein